MDGGTSEQRHMDVACERFRKYTNTSSIFVRPAWRAVHRQRRPHGGGKSLEIVTGKKSPLHFPGALLIMHLTRMPVQICIPEGS